MQIAGGDTRLLKSVWSLLLAISILWSGQATSQSAEGRLIYSVAPEVVAASTTSQFFTVDVFWCDGDKFAESRKVAAAEVASSIATFARLTQGASSAPDKPDSIIRTVRVRPLAMENLGRLQIDPGSNQIFYPDTSQQTRTFVNAMIGYSGTALIPILDSQPTSGYIRAVMCQNVDLNKIPALVFIQIASQEQQLAGLDLARAINSAPSNVSAAAGIETVGKKAPEDAEVRYFFDGDSATARAVADTFQSVIKKDVAVKYIPGLAASAKPGTLEAWFPRTFSNGRTVVLCEGELRSNCPAWTEWIPCYTQTSVWASQQPNCSKFVEHRLSSRGGNKCGYEFREVACSGD